MRGKLDPGRDRPLLAERIAARGAMDAVTGEPLSVPERLSYECA